MRDGEEVISSPYIRWMESVFRDSGEISGTGNVVCVPLTSTSSNDFCDVGYKQNDPLHVRFTKIDSTIYLNEGKCFRDLESEKNLPCERLLTRTLRMPCCTHYKIAAYTPDSTAVVIDVTPIFTTDMKEFAFLPTTIMGLIQLNSVFNKDGVAFRRSQGV